MRKLEKSDIEGLMERTHMNISHSHYYSVAKNWMCT